MNIFGKIGKKYNFTGLKFILPEKLTEHFVT
jgi:hypothetical protein